MLDRKKDVTLHGVRGTPGFLYCLILAIYRMNTENDLSQDGLRSEKKMAGVMGLEPTAFAVTGRRCDQLNYTPALFGVFFEHRSPPL